MLNIKHAEELYHRIKDKLKGQEGKIVAIEVESGDYFVGADAVEAHAIGAKMYPNREFFYKRIGAKSTFFVGAS